MSDSESRSQVSYLSFQVTICLSRLVSEIFACDRQTDRWTTWTITIAGPHIVAGQLIKYLLPDVYQKIIAAVLDKVKI